MIPAIIGLVTCLTLGRESGYYDAMEHQVTQQSASWTMSELSALFAGGTASGQQITGVTVDSRLVEPGDLFVALAGDPGERFHPSVRSAADGHDYIAHALARGALAALVARPQDLPIPQFETADTYTGLWQLGAAARARLPGPVIAVTGSSGKTTAKTFLAAALDAYAPPGSFNNHIGVPLSLANAWQQAPAWVFEIGTSYPGEIQPLTEMVQPDLAILLNVHNAHIENFTSRDALIEEKAAIYCTLPSSGLRVVHDELGISGYRFGHGHDSDARITSVHGDTMTLSLFGEPLTARVPGGGAHRALTLSACVLAAKLLALDIGPALSLDDAIVPSGRGDVRFKGGVEVVDDSYNANPNSMKAALSAFLAEPANGKRYACLGEMRELGDESATAHRELLESVADDPALHGMVLVGQAMQQAWSEMEAEGSNHQRRNRMLATYGGVSSDTAAQLVARLEPGDRVLVKGSNRVFWAEGFVDQLLAQL
jgi:UDP-N-acetylmuramoyl-tripeptide--D-alanyl-D-alanine ligase